MPLIDDFKLRIEKLAPGGFRDVHARVSGMARIFEDDGPDMQAVVEGQIPATGRNIGYRLYVPHGAKSGGPLHIFYHGGGFVACSLDSHDGICRRVAVSSTHRVLSIDYRLAPEHPFPAATDDAEAALLWAMAHGDQLDIDSKLISIGGDSAGGNLTAYLAQKYRRELGAQILFYPLMQMVNRSPFKPDWHDRLGLGPAALNYIDKVYIKGADLYDPRISPLFETHLKGLPPAYVLTCELDPLRDEGRAYADKLEAAGVKVKRRHEKAMPHGFLNFSRAFPPGKTVPSEAGEFLRKIMAERAVRKAGAA